MLKAVHAQEDAEAAKQKARPVVEKLCAMKLAKAAEIVEHGIGEALSYYKPTAGALTMSANQQPARTPYARDRRRTQVLGTFSDGNSALMLVVARLRHVAATRWGTKHYLQMDWLAEIVATPMHRDNLPSASSQATSAWIADDAKWKAEQEKQLTEAAIANTTGVRILAAIRSSHSGSADETRPAFRS